jgi:hypothetical protein
VPRQWCQWIVMFVTVNFGGVNSVTSGTTFYVAGALIEGFYFIFQSFF